MSRACVEECPVDCIYEGASMLYIHPEECVDCGACEAVCPVEAIFYEDDVPSHWKHFVDAAVDFATRHPGGGASKVGAQPFDSPLIERGESEPQLKVPAGWEVVDPAQRRYTFSSSDQGLRLGLMGPFERISWPELKHALLFFDSVVVICDMAHPDLATVRENAGWRQLESLGLVRFLSLTTTADLTDETLDDLIEGCRQGSWLQSTRYQRHMNGVFWRSRQHALSTGRSFSTVGWSRDYYGRIRLAIPQAIVRHGRGLGLTVEPILVNDRSGVHDLSQQLRLQPGEGTPIDVPGETALAAVPDMPLPDYLSLRAAVVDEFRGHLELVRENARRLSLAGTQRGHGEWALLDEIADNSHRLRKLFLAAMRQPSPPLGLGIVMHAQSRPLGALPGDQPPHDSFSFFLEPMPSLMRGDYRFFYQDVTW